MREVNLKWFRQAYIEERPNVVWTEFMLDDGRKFQTFALPFARDSGLTIQVIIDVIDFQPETTVICNAETESNESEDRRRTG